MNWNRGDWFQLKRGRLIYGRVLRSHPTRPGIYRTDTGDRIQWTDANVMEPIQPIEDIEKYDPE